MQTARKPLFWNYTRYSTPPQQWGTSDERQVNEGRRRAEDLGYEFVDTYRDLGISAFHSRNRTNGALGNFLADLKSGPPPLRNDPWPMPGDVLHCESFDRLSRAEPEDSLKLFMEILDSGCVLMVRDQKYTPAVMREKRYLWQVVLNELIRAHEESLRKSGMLLDAYAGNRARAKNRQRAMVGKRCPAWLQPIEKPERGQWPLYEFVPPEEGGKPSRADLYRQAWEMYDRGVGSHLIANYFNDTKVPVLAKRINAKPTQGWTAQLVRQLLTNVAAMGVYQPKKVGEGGRKVIGSDCEPMEGYYPALVDEILFLRVRAALKSAGTKGKKGPHGQDYANLFKGLCVCGHNHDHSVNIGYKSKEGLRYLRCDQSRHRNCPNTGSFQYERLERMVLGFVGVGMMQVFASLIPKHDVDPRQRRLVELEAIISSREEQMQVAWNRWFGPDATTSPTLRERAEQQIARIDAEINDLKAEFARLREEVKVIGADDDTSFYQRVREAKRQLETAEGESRYAIRLKLAQELRRKIEHITLDEGVATVRFKRRYQGAGTVQVRFTATGVPGVEHLDANDKPIERIIIPAAA